MDFKLVTSLVNNVIKAVENSAVASVSATKKHTFKTEVVNLPDVQSVKGEIRVVNQVDKVLKETNKLLKDLDESIQKESRLERKVEVTNTHKPNLSKLESSSEHIYSILKTVVKNVQSLHEPLRSLKTIEVDNQPIKELEAINKSVRDLKETISKLELNPQITVSPSQLPPVNVPPAQVTVEQVEIDYQTLAETLAERLFSKNSKEYISVRLSDGKDFYKAIENLIIDGQSGGKSYAFRDSEGNFAHGNLDDAGNVLTANDDFLIQDLEEGEPLYLGAKARDGRWRIMKLSNESEMRYATGTTDYSSNWNNRASLSYGYS